MPTRGRVDDVDEYGRGTEARTRCRHSCVARRFAWEKPSRPWIREAGTAMTSRRGRARLSVDARPSRIRTPRESRATNGHRWCRAMRSRRPLDAWEPRRLRRGARARFFAHIPPGKTLWWPLRRWPDCVDGAKTRRTLTGAPTRADMETVKAAMLSGLKTTSAAFANVHRVCPLGVSLAASWTISAKTL